MGVVDSAANLEVLTSTLYLLFYLVLMFYAQLSEGFAHLGEQGTFQSCESEYSGSFWVGGFVIWEVQALLLLPKQHGHSLPCYLVSMSKLEMVRLGLSLSC